MNLYLVSQHDNKDWDTYDSFVCAAETEEEAQRMVPGWSRKQPYWGDKGVADSAYPAWAVLLENVEVEYLGVARPGMPKGIVIDSFNAG